jgi:hypothetical protein
MSSLLEMAKSWTHSNLSLYINNGAIFSVSATTNATTEKACLLYEEVLGWLRDNGLVRTIVIDWNTGADA